MEGSFTAAVKILGEAGSYKGDEGTYCFLCNYGKQKLDEAKRKYKKLSKEERAKVFADEIKYKILFSCYKCLFCCGWLKPEKSNNPLHGKTSRSDADEAARIRASASYKIGRCITFIPRKIYGSMKCYKQHGLQYTVHRFFVHLHIRKA